MVTPVARGLDRSPMESSPVECRRATGSGGVIRLDGRTVQGPGYDRGMVFQDSRLLPWRTATENVEFGLEIKRVPRQERRAIAERFINIVGLTGFEDRHPHQLSGGMRQRV